MTKERRKAPRIEERVSMSITEKGSEIEAETKNISASGAYCTLDRFIAPMTKLQLRFELPGGAQNIRIRCMGVVVRAEPVVATVERGQYHIAIFFQDLSERDRDKIARFVQRRIRSSSSSG